MSDYKALVMVVDDDIDSLKLIGMMLQRSGYQAIAANGGSMALHKAATEKPDVIILDVMMPDMTGYEVIKRLRANVETKHIPIIMFTAKTLVDDKVAGFEAGADDYLTKPTHPAELDSRVRAILSRSHAKLSKAQLEELRAHRESITRARRRLRTVLIAHSDAPVARATALNMSVMGYDSIIAISADDALNKLASETEKPCLLITDLNMPGMDDSTFLKHALLYPYTPVIVLIPEDEAAAPAPTEIKGADAYVEYPYDLNALIDTMKDVVQKRSKQIRAQFWKALYHSDERIRGRAVVELALLYKEAPYLFPNTPAQDPFWHNVRHTTQGTPNRADAERKWAAYSELAKVLIAPKPEQDSGLIRLTGEDQEADIRSQALVSLGLNRHADAFGLIVKATYDEDKKIRRAAVEALGHLKDVRSIGRLEECLADSASAVRVAAVQSLATIGTDMAFRILQEYLFEGSVELRSDIVMVLARQENDTAADILIEAAQKDMHENVLYGITQALARMEAERAVPILTNLGSHESDHVREGAHRALENFQ